MSADIDYRLYKKINEKPGSSIRELANEMGWSIVEVFKSVCRLEKGSAMNPEEQTARIAGLETQIDLLQNEIFELRKGKDSQKAISDLMAQVAALKEIAVEQKAAHIAFVGFHRNMNEDETKNKAQDEARRQLAEEHPEAFG